ncbi:Hpt domain-containing protein [Candidatus Soleaferrea massiliensis]|uniref:Hpt domain-containing protein n=1 Tax=Candidatus Soleaferrea massiliensis TaxID=1470354 RepID=UPI00058FD2EE|nr:Hpt domain-containing protein [Candidatus Soleaferrea massiliensis]
MQGFKELFEAYGADYQATMNRFMGNEAMYMRLLDMLFRDTGLSALGAALEANDLSAAFEAAHALKGVVGNMGLTPLYNAVNAIVEPLRAGERHEDYPSLYQAIQIEFQKADRLREGLKGGDRA